MSQQRAQERAIRITGPPVIGRARAERSRRLITGLAAFVAFHLVMVLAYVLPVPLGPARGLVTGYVEPVFKQRWAVFAPDPVSSNTYLSVRARTKNGAMTPWFGVTRCDIDTAILHHPVPNRRYLTTFMLTNHYRANLEAMPEAAQKVATQDATGADWSNTMRDAAVRAGASETQAAAFIKTERAMTNLMSQVARSRWGDVTSIQFEIKQVDVPRYADRDSTKPPRTTTWRSGQVPAWSGSPASQKSVDAVYAPEAGC